MPVVSSEGTDCLVRITYCLQNSYCKSQEQQLLSKTINMQKIIKKQYEAPVAEVRLVLVEDGFATSSIIEGFEFDDEITW